MRARLALAVSGVQYELRELVLRNKPAELLAVSRKATVPVLVLTNGVVIDESLDIMLWALQQGDIQPWLMPLDTPRDDMLTLVAVNDSAFKQSLDRYKYPNRYPEETIREYAGDAKAFAMAHRMQCSIWLAGLEMRLIDGWLFGPRASLADMALLPFVRQFAHTDAVWFALQPWFRLQAWLANFEASALFLAVMEKIAPWRPPGS